MDLLEMAGKAQKIVRDLMHGNVSQEHIEMITIDELSDEILKEIGIENNTSELKKALMNMYFLGTLNKK
jgi:hypothetical protein